MYTERNEAETEEQKEKRRIESRNKNHIKHKFADPSRACRLVVSVRVTAQRDIYCNLWRIIITFHRY